MNMNEQTGKEDRAITVKPYSRLVSLPIRPEHIFHFPQGLPAFEDFKDYVFTIKPDTSPFIFMHAIEPAGLSFVCVDPFLVHLNYAPRIGPADQDFLQLRRIEDLVLLSIVTVRRDVRETTANLQGPIAINMQNSIAKQIMCDGQSYPVRHRIWDTIETMRVHEEEMQQQNQSPVAAGCN
jgi:flagellar assembly factor FliW